MPVKHSTKNNNYLTLTYSPTYKYNVCFFKEVTEGEFKGRTKLFAKINITNEFTQKQTEKSLSIHILEIIKKNPEYKMAVSWKTHEKIVLKKSIVKEYYIEYECYKTGVTEEIVYATQRGEAIKIGDACEKTRMQNVRANKAEYDEEYIKWYKKEYKGYNLEHDWRYCTYNYDYYIEEDDDRVNVEGDINDIEIDDKDDIAILKSIEKWERDIL